MALAGTQGPLHIKSLPVGLNLHIYKLACLILGN